MSLWGPICEWVCLRMGGCRPKMSFFYWTEDDWPCHVLGVPHLQTHIVLDRVHFVLHTHWWQRCKWWCPVLSVASAHSPGWPVLRASDLGSHGGHSPMVCGFHLISKKSNRQVIGVHHSSSFHFWMDIKGLGVYKSNPKTFLSWDRRIFEFWAAFKRFQKPLVFDDYRLLKRPNHCVYCRIHKNSMLGNGDVHGLGTTQKLCQSVSMFSISGFYPRSSPPLCWSL